MENIPPLPPPTQLTRFGTLKVVSSLPPQTNAETYSHPPSSSPKPQQAIAAVQHPHSMPSQPTPRVSTTSFTLSARNTEKLPTTTESHMGKQSAQMSSQASAVAAPIVEGGGHLSRKIDRPSAGNSLVSQNTPRARQRSELNPPKQRSAPQGDVLGGPERITIRPAGHPIGESKIIVEVKTNVLVNDEWTLCYAIIGEVARLYSRSTDSVLVSVHHSVCILFQSTFEPTYLMTISVPPSELASLATRHNASAIQKMMYETMGVDSSRGVLQFLAVPIEHVAWNGRTCDRPPLEPSPIMAKAEAEARARLSTRSFSAFSRDQTPTVPPIPEGVPDVPTRLSQSTAGTPGPPSADTGSESGRDKAQAKPLKQKKSFVTSLFARRIGSRQDIGAHKEKMPGS